MKLMGKVARLMRRVSACPRHSIEARRTARSKWRLFRIDESPEDDCASYRRHGSDRTACPSSSASMAKRLDSRVRIHVALTVAMLFASTPMTLSAFAASDPKYLLFHIFTGAPDSNGVYREALSPDQILAMAKTIQEIVRPPSPASNRILGFDIGPIAMDQGAAEAVETINAGFDAALTTDMAMAIHLDDRMFWKNATWPDGSSLLATPGTIEWSDWNGATAPPLSIGWLPNTNLAPPMCYMSPTVESWTQYWLVNVIGPAVVSGYQRLVAAGKPQLFAGIFAGWESNVQNGYCSLSYLGYSATNPPPSFPAMMSYVLSQHVALWTRSLAASGIPTDLIYTHLAWPTVQPWVAFNPWSRPGWTNYVWPNDFSQIYGAVGSTRWVQAEGSNIATPAGCPTCVPDSPSPYSWETYLAKSFNHGASLVDIFEAFQGEPGAFQAATGPEAIAAYRKFLSGNPLVESAGRKPSRARALP